mgnify:CR=1 FL=1
MNLAISKVTSKGQTTIPQNLRQALLISAGDHVIFSLKGQSIVITKMTPHDQDLYTLSLSSTMKEWSSPEEDQAWHDL